MIKFGMKRNIVRVIYLISIYLKTWHCNVNQGQLFYSDLHITQYT